MRKKFLVSVGAVVMSASFVMTSCGKVDPGVQVDASKSTLYVTTRNAGIGVEWLQKIADEFEKKYANVSFEEGKLGVQVIDEPDSSVGGSADLSVQPGAAYSVIVNDCVSVATYMQQSMLANVADVVKGTMDFNVTDVDGNVVSMGETKTLESKLFPQANEYLGATGGYYALPWTLSYASLPYNETVWKNKMLYFADDKEDAIYLLDEQGNRQLSNYTGKAYTGRGFITSKGQDKSPGPDGEYNTYDDGMPSTYEEFVYVLDYMVEEKGVAPFICFSGNNYEYSNKFYAAFACSYDSAEDLKAMFDGYTTGDNTVEIVTGWKDGGNEPDVEDISVSQKDGYLFSQRASKYYALDLLKKTLANSKYRNSRFGDPSHAITQKYFVQSTLVPGEQPIAMLLDGSFWYYEADTSLKSAEANYGSIDDIKVLPIPRQLYGTVDEEQGTVWSLPNELNVYMYLNANVTNNTVTEKLSKLFLRFAYTDEMLALYTEITSLPVAVKYDIGNKYDNLSSYGKNQWDIYKKVIENDALVFPFSTSATYKNNPTYYDLMSHTEMWRSTGYSCAFTEFQSVTPIPVKSWFINSWTSESDWDRYFLEK